MNAGAFLFGIQPSIDGSSLLDTATAFEQVGNNTGNLAFHFAIVRQLALTTRLDWASTPSEIDAVGGVAVIPCANQVGEHLDMGGMADKLSKTHVSCVAIGLGAQAGLDMSLPKIPAGTVRWLSALAERAPRNAPNISVRGEFSRRVLESSGFGNNAVVLGCPTLFLNPDPELGKKLELRLKPPERIAVVAGHYRWKHLAKLEASLASFATATRGEYIIQSPEEMVALARGDITQLSEAFLTECRDFCRPHQSVAEFVAWAHQHARAFFNVPAWMEYLRRFDFVIGARIHGVMLALQAGVPALCVAHDSRTLELCETMKVPFVHARQVINGIRRDELVDLARFDGDAFDRNRLELGRRYHEFLTANGLCSVQDSIVRGVTEDFHVSI